MKSLTPRAFFEDIVPQALKTRAAVAALPSMNVTFFVVGDTGGVWTIRMNAKGSEVLAEDDVRSELRFTVSDRAFEDILCGKLDAKRALESAAMTIEGDWALLDQLAFLFAPPGRAWQRP